MSKSGITKYLPQTSAFNTILFYNFIKILQDHIESLNIGVVFFVIDNVPFHKSTSIRQVIENRGNRLLLLPPYSPFLNPIENMFSKWKPHIRQARPENEAVLFK